MRVPTARMTAHRLDGVLSVDYDVSWSESDDREHHQVVRVNFPDEARSLLVSLPWRNGHRVVDLLSDVGSAYLARCLSTPHPERLARDDGPGPATLNVPFDYFCSVLEAMGFHEAAKRSPGKDQ